MTATTPTQQRWKLDKELREGPMFVLVDGEPFKVLSSLRNSKLYVGTFIDESYAGLLMKFNPETKAVTTIDANAGLQALYMNRLAIPDFVSHLVRAVQCSGRDYRTVSDEIARSLYGAGLTAEMTVAQWSACAPENAIDHIRADIDWIWVQARAHSRWMTLQITLAVLAKLQLDKRRPAGDGQ